LANDVVDPADPGVARPDDPRPAGEGRDLDAPVIKVVDRRWWATRESGAGTADRGLRKPTFVEQLERQLAEKDEQLRTTLSKFKEASQEFEEARVRARRDVTKEIERGKRAILVELLDVVDNLDRAIAAAKGAAGAETLLQGVEMVRDQFLTRLEGFGVARIVVIGERFDPALHEAATTVPTADPTHDDCVVGVIREGYRIGNEVLRPAVVAVGKAMAEPRSPSPGSAPGSFGPSGDTA
jgi:molecular chaperone GrpE